MTVDVEKSVVGELLDDLLAQMNPKNPRDHDIGMIITSYRRFGFKGAITKDPDTDSIVAGHGRLKALKSMWRDDPTRPPEGIEIHDNGEWVVPVLYERFANETERDAYLVADNRAVLLGGWDETALVELLVTLSESDQGLVGTGYDGDDLDMFLGLMSQPDVPDAPPPDQAALAGSYRQQRFGVTVNVDSMHDEDEICELLAGHGYQVKRHSR